MRELSSYLGIPGWECCVPHEVEMAEVAVEVLGLVLAIVGWCLESSSTNSAVWRIRSHADSVVTSSSQYEGLWTTCSANAMGAIQCQRYKTILGLPGEFLANMVGFGSSW
ncbi:hypothetical protein NFI96_031928 [Prochilodus magdalenae]|nr:hypothetical protein NFI96_031928 [Prochilodus magdalenae]